MQAYLESYLTKHKKSLRKNDDVVFKFLKRKCGESWIGNITLNKKTTLNQVLAIIGHLLHHYDDFSFSSLRVRKLEGKVARLTSKCREQKATIASLNDSVECLRYNAESLKEKMKRKEERQMNFMKKKEQDIKDLTQCNQGMVKMIQSLQNDLLSRKRKDEEEGKKRKDFSNELLETFRKYYPDVLPVQGGEFASTGVIQPIPQPLPQYEILCEFDPQLIPDGDVKIGTQVRGRVKVTKMNSPHWVPEWNSVQVFNSGMSVPSNLGRFDFVVENPGANTLQISYEHSEKSFTYQVTLPEPIYHIDLKTTPDTRDTEVEIGTSLTCSMNVTIQNRNEIEKWSQVPEIDWRKMKIWTGDRVRACEESHFKFDLRKIGMTHLILEYDEKTKSTFDFYVVPQLIDRSKTKIYIQKVFSNSFTSLDDPDFTAGGLLQGEEKKSELCTNDEVFIIVELKNRNGENIEDLSFTKLGEKTCSVTISGQEGGRGRTYRLQSRKIKRMFYFVKEKISLREENLDENGEFVVCLTKMPHLRASVFVKKGGMRGDVGNPEMRTNLEILQQQQRRKEKEERKRREREDRERREREAKKRRERRERERREKEERERIEREEREREERARREKEEWERKEAKERKEERKKKKLELYRRKLELQQSEEGKRKEETEVEYEEDDEEVYNRRTKRTKTRTFSICLSGRINTFGNDLPLELKRRLLAQDVNCTVDLQKDFEKCSSRPDMHIYIATSRTLTAMVNEPTERRRMKKMVETSRMRSAVYCHPVHVTQRGWYISNMGKSGGKLAKLSEKEESRDFQSGILFRTSKQEKNDFVLIFNHEGLVLKDSNNTLGEKQFAELLDCIMRVVNFKFKNIK